MKIVGLVQARMGSTRLPGKVLKKIIDKPMIELLLERLSKSNELDEIVVATSEKVFELVGQLRFSLPDKNN